MITFRPQRGSLNDAMKEVVTLADDAALIEHLRAIHPVPFGSENVRVEQYGPVDPRIPAGWYDDLRIGWRNVKLVTIEGHCVGFLTREPVEDPKP